MNQYHDTHYMFFYRTLPDALRGVIFDELLAASKNGEGHAYMIGFWRATAKFVSGVGPFGTLPRELDLTRDDFNVSVLSPASGWTFLVITGPPVKGGLEALVAVAAFTDADPTQSLKYYTCEAPAMSGAPWMIGMWHADSSRGNLGAIDDVSITGMVDFVCRHLGLLNSPELSVDSSQEEDEDEFTQWARNWKKGDPIPIIPPGRTLKLDSFGLKPSTRPKFGGERESGSSTTFGSGSVSIPKASGPVANSMTWGDSPFDIAQEAVQNLYRLRSAGKTAFVMSAKKASGLSKTVSSYVQFMWLEDDALVVELQADYSYWGLSIPSSAWANLEAAGLARPNGKELNFHLLIPAGVDPSERLNVLAGVFDAFQTVMRPAKKIQQSSF